ncbi:MAG TPA: YciI family protein [Gaiellaceae bacterium]|nr:YciI family protein [Gaiellaceae bacterium]
MKYALLISDAASGRPEIGGLYLVEAEDIDHALDLAERIPAARLGGAVEIRPIVENEPSR